MLGNRDKGEVVRGACLKSDRGDVHRMILGNQQARQGAHAIG
jgi:hypothetical protein